MFAQLFQSGAGRTVCAAVEPVVQGLESRMLLSVSVGEEEVYEEPVVEEGGEVVEAELMYTTMIDEGGEGPAEGDGEVVYFDDGTTTAGGEEILEVQITNEEGEPAPEGEVPEEWMYLTGEPTDGNPDEVTPISLPLPTVQRSGRVLTITGTDRNDTISLHTRGPKLLVDFAGGDVQKFKLRKIHRIIVNAGEGNDRLSARRLTIGVTFNGEAGNDRIVGSNRRDRISGGDGHDRILGLGGRDLLTGGNGRDRVRGEISGDSISGGMGADTLAGGGGDDEVVGGSGRDVIRGGRLNDLIVGGFGRDRIYGNDGVDSVQDSRGAADADGDDASGIRLAYPEWWAGQSDIEGIFAEEPGWADWDGDMIGGDATGDEPIGGGGGDDILDPDDSLDMRIDPEQWYAEHPGEELTDDRLGVDELI
jgi:Ca2+-binding RTX toxin-like protein